MEDELEDELEEDLEDELEDEDGGRTKGGICDGEWTETWTVRGEGCQGTLSSGGSLSIWGDLPVLGVVCSEF